MRTLNLILVLPLVLREFSVAEVALWQVFSSLIGLQMLVDLGFSFTFTRLFAYAMGGAKDLGSSIYVKQDFFGKEANWILLRKIFGVTRLIYARLSWILFVVLAICGTLALVRRVQALGLSPVAYGNMHLETTTLNAWVAWTIVLVTTVIGFRCSTYATFLQGTNHVALVRRWEAFFGLGSILTSVMALLFGGGLLALVLSNQTWVIFNAWRNRWLVQQVCGGRFKRLPEPTRNKEIFSAAWSPAWRTGIGAFMSLGVIQISGLIYAQSRDTVAVAAYLLGLRLVQTVSQISQAPFYSKLPILAQLWAQGRVDEEVATARHGMTMSYWTFVVSFILLGLMGPWLLLNIGSQTPFPDKMLWGLFGAAILCERYGAMHLHLYGTTNHIVSHIANSVTGIIFITVAVLVFPNIGVYAFPVAMITSYLSFYTWYCSRRSHHKLSLSWPWFDLRSVGGPAVCLAVYLLYAFKS